MPGDLMVGSEGKRARNEKISQAKKKRSTPWKAVRTRGGGERLQKYNEIKTV